MASALPPLVDRIHRLRRAGFFAGGGATAEAVLARLREGGLGLSPDALPGPPEASMAVDLALVRHDRARVWDAAVGLADALPYAAECAALVALSALTRGALTIVPTGLVVEDGVPIRTLLVNGEPDEWESTLGPTRAFVTTTLGALVEDLNLLLWREGAPLRLYALEPGGGGVGAAVVIGLEPGEVAVLEADCGWTLPAPVDHDAVVLRWQDDAAGDAGADDVEADDAPADAPDRGYDPADPDGHRAQARFLEALERLRGDVPETDFVASLADRISEAVPARPWGAGWTLAERVAYFQAFDFFDDDGWGDAPDAVVAHLVAGTGPGQTRPLAAHGWEDDVAGDIELVRHDAARVWVAPWVPTDALGEAASGRAAERMAALTRGGLSVVPLGGGTEHGLRVRYRSVNGRPWQAWLGTAAQAAARALGDAVDEVNDQLRASHVPVRIGVLRGAPRAGEGGGEGGGPERETVLVGLTQAEARRLGAERGWDVEVRGWG